MHENDVLDDPRASEWLRTALRAALQCDPVTAANEAEQLVRLLRMRVVRLAQQEALMLSRTNDALAADPQQRPRRLRAD